ncbi:S1 RNA-binding domain-containing protein [Bremerella cremea]|uniref:S1 RNA-binding domain-containing protein n=1 Tax=Bremerella cremea TaxID=1031537 RepID=A0A368KJH7_9BACT|nr:S1 RNA-binding domain-containing protein [Bremerella cremea]RCS40721.1 S1 RNA-binding domain-containing protein [Bremerella cremea]
MSTDPQKDPASADPSQQNPEASAEGQSTPETQAPEQQTSEQPAPASPEAVAGESGAEGEESDDRKKVLIGSQRNAPPQAAQPKPPQPKKPVRPARPQEDKDDPTQIPADISATLADATQAEAGEPDYRLPVEGGKVQVPNRRETLDDIEAEIAAVMGDRSLDDVMGPETVAPSASRLEDGARVNAVVIRVHREDVFFDLPGGNQGIASVRNFVATPVVGDKMEVSIGEFQAGQRLYEVGIPGSSISVQDWGDIREGVVVDAVVDGVNKGGLECAVGTVRGFIPASQAATYHVDKLEDFLGSKLQCLVTEANPEKRNLVLSARAVAEKLQEDSKKELLGNLAVGQIREGKVTRIQDFGAFVDLGGVDGLVHVSQISWERVKHPSDVLAEGQIVKVKVTKMDPETGKIGLSIRDTMENPWQKVASEFAVGKVIPGKVTKLMEFGAFVEIAPGIEGLVHVSEVSYSRISRVSSVLKVGEEVEVKVLSIDQGKRRISLSIKATQPPPADARQGGRKKDDFEGDIDREVSVKKSSNQPLKGGITNDQSEGSKFGLKW